MHRIITTVLGLAAATSLLMACSSSATEDDVQPAPASSTGTTTTPAADVTTVKFPSGTGRQSADNRGAWDLVLRDVRLSERDGFDRVVLEFKGRGTPAWNAEYVTTPRAEGSGELVDVDGDNFLAVSISGVILRKGYPETPEDFFRGPRHFAPERGGEIEDVNIGGPFEGYSQLFLGIDGDKVPFRVLALTNPSRLVVDVKDD